MEAHETLADRAGRAAVVPLAILMVTIPLATLVPGTSA